MKMKHTTLVFMAMLAAVASSRADLIKPINPAEFDHLHKMIQPSKGESPWRDVAWETNVTNARRRAIAENKPIVIFTAADGSPLGRT